MSAMRAATLCLLLLASPGNCQNASGERLGGKEKGQGADEFVENTKPLISIMRNELQYMGNWDSAGDFIRAPGMSVYRVGQPFRTMPPSAVRPANMPFGVSTEKVYEFRSGMLIKGILERNGNFVPDLDSKVMPFAEYRPNERTLRIYNLPGRFVKRAGNEDK
jgi:hypothetical protein